MTNQILKIINVGLIVASCGGAQVLAQGMFNAPINGSPWNVPIANIIHISGSSALTGSLASVVAKNCVGGALNIHNLSAGSAGRIIICNTGSVDASYIGQKFAVVKRDTNGSFDGVSAVIDGAMLGAWPDENRCDSPLDTCGVTTATVPHASNRKPRAGLSDINVDVWRGLAMTGELGKPVSGAPYVSVSGVAGQGFGIMASDALYRAMQVKQFNAGKFPAACSNIAAPGATVASVAAVDASFTPGNCQPSISKEEYAAVVSGNNFAYIANGALSGDANPVNLCRRVETSGTQAISTAYFLNNPCTNANPTFGMLDTKKVDLGNSPTAVSFNNANFNIANIVGNYDDFGGAFGLFEGSSTSDARNCVIRRNLGQNPNAVADTLGNYALGFLSLENAPPAVGWKYLKLNGVSPNATQVLPVGTWATDATRRLNVISGLYDLSPELEYIRPVAYASHFTTPAAMQTFLATLAEIMAAPVRVVTPGLYQANGTYTNAAFPTQVHKGTRGGNFCAPMTLAE